jgi:hypothetical protein
MKTLVLFNYDWDLAGFARNAPAWPHDVAGFDLFSFPSNAHLAWFDMTRFVERWHARPNGAAGARWSPTTSSLARWQRHCWPSAWAGQARRSTPCWPASTSCTRAKSWHGPAPMPTAALPACPRATATRHPMVWPTRPLSNRSKPRFRSWRAACTAAKNCTFIRALAFGNCG